MHIVRQDEHVRRDQLAHGEQLLKLLARMLHERLEFQRRFRDIAGLFQGLIAHTPIGLELHVDVHAHFEAPLHQEFEAPIRHLQHPQDRGHRPHPVQIIGSGLFDGPLTLRHQHELAVCIEGALDGPH